MLDLDRFLPFHLATVAVEVGQALSRAYGESHGLTIAEWRVMALLGHDEGITAKAVGRTGRMHKTVVSRALAGLESRGLVSRRAGKDMREAHLFLTPDGRKVYEAIVPKVRALAEELEAGLTPEERAQLSGLLRKLGRRSSELLAA